MTIRFSAHTEAGGGPGAYAPGQTETFTLARGDVLQIVSARSFAPAQCSGSACIGGPEYDLTGTSIEADKPVALFSGHSCSFIPFDRWACDHHEEQIFPLEAWGSSIIAAATEPQVGNEPNVWKVVSGSANNAITFEPAVQADVTLGEGAYIEFQAQGAFRMTGTGRVALAQFMVGEDFNGKFTEPAVGDPAMGLGVPYEQFRTSYDFLTPATYTKSYVNVIAKLGALPTLDDAVVPELTAIADTGFGYVRIEIAPGAHHIESTIDPDGFGITVSGIASYTSYLYPGGLDLESLPIE